MPFKYSVKKDIPDDRDHIAMRAGVPLPNKVDLSKFMGPVKNQEQEGSCTAHAGTEIREFLYRQFYQYEHNKTVPADQFQLAPQFFYKQERLAEGDFNQDGGAQSRTMMQVMSKTGCCLEKSNPYVQSDMYVMPSASQIAEALEYRNTSYHRVLDIGTAKSVLASGYVCSLGFPVYESFESDSVAKDGKVPIPKDSEQCLGGHEVVIYGYQDDFVNLDGSKGCFLVRNSWSDTWGHSGNFFLPYTFLEKYDGDWDLWVAHLGKPWVAKK